MENKHKQSIMIGIIIILAVTLIFQITANKRNQGAEDFSKQNNSSALNEANKTPSIPDYMKPQIPVALSDNQKAELKAGSDDHKPTELTFNISGGSFYFTPNEFKVKQGDKVKIIFTNVGGMHNLVLPDFKVETRMINTNESDTIEFTADKKGTFEFYCSVGKGYHRQMGQIGVLIVE